MPSQHLPFDLTSLRDTLSDLTLHLVLLIAYSVGVVGLGLWTARLVRTSGDFFVAGRALGPGLIFATMLAANIGSGATVGVAGLAYRDGISAWWWSGSAGLASLVLAFWVGPRIWAIAREQGFLTTGDFLEFRYGPVVRGVVSVLILLGSLAILAGQLIAGAAILNVVTGAPRWVGSLVGGAIMTTYFAAGGLRGTALVNTVQLVVMLAGFAIALPFALDSVGGLERLLSELPAHFGDVGYSAGPGSGWTLLFLTGPAFIVSPGLIQKGVRSVERTRSSCGGCAQRPRVDGVRVPARAAGHGGASCATGHPGSEPRAPDAPARATAGLARRARDGGGVLHGSGYVRRDPVHDLDIGGEGSLQAPCTGQVPATHSFSASPGSPPSPAARWASFCRFT